VLEGMTFSKEDISEKNSTEFWFGKEFGVCPPKNSSGEALFSLEFLSYSSSGNERGWLLTSHRGLERKAQDPSAEIILAREK
jgi:hypothetical protein